MHLGFYDCPGGFHLLIIQHVLIYLQIALFIVDRDEFFQLLVFAPKRIVELWRFVTYIFLHTNFTHLALNVVIQVSRRRFIQSTTYK